MPEISVSESSIVRSKISGKPGSHARGGRGIVEGGALGTLPSGCIGSTRGAGGYDGGRGGCGGPGESG